MLDVARARAAMLHSDAPRRDCSGFRSSSARVASSPSSQRARKPRSFCMAIQVFEASVLVVAGEVQALYWLVSIVVKLCKLCFRIRRGTEAFGPVVIGELVCEDTRTSLMHPRSEDSVLRPLVLTSSARWASVSHQHRRRVLATAQEARPPRLSVKAMTETGSPDGQSARRPPRRSHKASPVAPVFSRPLPRALPREL